MSKMGSDPWREWLSRALLLLLLLAVGVSFLPLVETNAWWIRYADFPRLQLAVVLLVLVALFGVLCRRPGRSGWTVVLLAVLAVGYHAWHLYPYSRTVDPVAISARSCAPGSSLHVMIANVQKRNEEAEEFLDLVAEVDPDVLLVMETDDWWDDHLVPLQDRYPEKRQFIPNDHGAYGMHLLSRRPLISPEFRFLFDAFTPTIFTGIELRDGAAVQFVGMHPRPPMWGQSTASRDAHLLSAALEARASETPTVIAGDLNAVPWESVMRRAKRIGSLLDPRIGRGLHPTFQTDSLLVSWPLDQVLYQDQLTLLDFEVLPDFGSDHYPVSVRLCHSPEAANLQSPPTPLPRDLEETSASIEAARSLDGSGMNN